MEGAEGGEENGVVDKKGLEGICMRMQARATKVGASLPTFEPKRDAPAGGTQDEGDVSLLEGEREIESPRDSPNPKGSKSRLKCCTNRFGTGGSVMFDSPDKVVLSSTSESEKSKSVSSGEEGSASIESDSNSGSSSSSSIHKVQRKQNKKQNKNRSSKDGKRKKDKGRKLVDNEHIGPLVQSYWKHFGKFSEGKKQKMKQIVPNKVWEMVYVDYKKLFPDSVFEEETLKDHLRDSVKDMKSGVNNPEEGEGATLQDLVLMKKLMESRSWKARSVLKIRQNAMQGTNSSSQVTNPEATGSVAPPRPPASSALKDPAAPKPPTKKESLTCVGYI